MDGHKTERKVQNINRKIVETESKWIPLIHICMPAHFSDLVQVLQENVAGLNYYKGPKSPIIMT